MIPSLGKARRKRPFQALNHDLSSLSNDHHEIIRETMNDRHLRKPDQGPNQALNSRTSPLSLSDRKRSMRERGRFARETLETQTAQLEESPLLYRLLQSRNNLARHPLDTGPRENIGALLRDQLPLPLQLARPCPDNSTASRLPRRP